MRKVIEKILSKLKLVVSRHDTVRTYTDDSYKMVVYSHFGQPVFKIPLEITRDFFGFDFCCKPQGYHPYTETLSHYLNNQNNNSLPPLYDYYKKFCPESTKSIFLEKDRITAEAGLFRYRLPWDYTAKVKPNGSRLNYCGPVSNNQIENELGRIYHVFNSIKTKGYVPQVSSDLFNSNHIQGYFLKRKDDYRFIVLHGKHRISSLAALNHTEIPVTFCMNKPRIIFLDDLPNWPGVRSGEFNEQEAAEVFNFFFDFNGLKLAEIYQIENQ